MIDEEIKSKVLIGMQKLGEKWKQEPHFAEPRTRWFQIGKMEYKKDNKIVHYVVAVMIGKDEEEAMQIINEISEVCERHRADQKDVINVEDYTRKKL